MALAGRALSPLTAVLHVQPEALALNNAWAVTGRRLVRAAVAKEQPNLVLATVPPPSALFAAARVVGDIPFVVEFRDLWAGNPYFDRGSRALRALQQRVLEKAAAVTTVTDGCRDVLAALHPDIAARVHVLPNGFDRALLEHRASTGPRSDGPTTLIHPGALYGDRTAEPLIAALEHGDLRKRTRLELLGVVDPRTRRALARARGVDVTVEPPVAWDDAIRRMLAADITVVINAASTGGDMALPNKLFEALALGRPVLALASPGSDTARLLERLGQDAGLAPPDDPQMIAAAVERLLADPPPPVPPDALAEYDRDRLAERYAELLDEVATPSSRSTSFGTTTSRR
jgi:glycosyltransferase involved in cell wall biosynthesis